MRVLITGAGGMLGSSIVESVRRTRPSDEVVAITRAEVDLRDADAVSGLVRDLRPDTVVHAAAVVGGISAKLAHPTPYLLDNLALDSSVLRAAIAVEVPEFLYIGSGAMYPEVSEQPIPETALLGGPLEPANEGYALAKIAAAKVCSYASKEFGFAYRVVAPSNLYGPNDDYSLGHGHLIAATIAKVHAAKIADDPTVTVWGDGTARREFTYAPDLADWLAGELGSLGRWPQLLNVGAGVDHSITAFYELARDIVGYSGDFVYDTDKPAGAARRLLDSSLARDLGWSPRTEIADGMRACYAHFLQTADGDTR